MLIEFYDYIEEIEQTNSKLSSNNIDNFLNLIVNIGSHFPDFNNNITDIKNIVLMVQGDTSKCEYFIHKMFFKNDNTSLAMGIIQKVIERLEPGNFVGSGYRSGGQPTGFGNRNGPSDGTWNNANRVKNFKKEEWTAILNRAESASPTNRDIFYLLSDMSGEFEKINLPELQRIVSRLGLQFTHHKFVEITSNVKEFYWRSSRGIDKPNFETVNLTEFEYLFRHLVDLIVASSLEALYMSKSHLLMNMIV